MDRCRGAAMPYTDFDPTAMILRDHLARERTMLAVERTLLAYVRTALALLAAGATLLHLYPGSLPYRALGQALLGLGAGRLVFGLWRCARTAAGLRRLRQPAGRAVRPAGADEV
ncbi:MAG: DUF202 domain-containing protein [Fimbriimonadaceae bacterium]|nr:DUF202 domain-containing protein [Fimbriimonadaceae bacterium]